MSIALQQLDLRVEVRKDTFGRRSITLAMSAFELGTHAVGAEAPRLPCAGSGHTVTDLL
jgi:hypothetical protein